MEMTPSTASPLTLWGRIAALNRALRTYQWVKNVLLFVPMLMAHEVRDADLWLHTALGFAAFSLGASFGYVVASP